MPAGGGGTDQGGTGLQIRGDPLRYKLVHVDEEEDGESKAGDNIRYRRGEASDPGWERDVGRRLGGVAGDTTDIQLSRLDQSINKHACGSLGVKSNIFVTPSQIVCVLSIFCLSGVI